MTATIYDDGLPTPQRYWSMAAIALGISMSVLDSSIATIALPSIARSVHAVGERCRRRTDCENGKLPTCADDAVAAEPPVAVVADR